MKNISLALNAVLLVAVGVLYFLHFSSGEEVPEEKELIKPEEIKIPLPDINSSIVYVDLMNLNEGYVKVKDNTDLLTTKQNQIKNQIDKKKNDLKKVLDDMKIRSAGWTEKEYAEAQYQIQQEEQNILSFQQSKSDGLMKLQQSMMDDAYDELQEYIAELNADNKYTYILGYTEGLNILHADTTLDITDKVVEGLNMRYAAEKSLKEQEAKQKQK